MVRSGEQHEMGIIAYCFMPDHVHLLVEARCESAEQVMEAAGWEPKMGSPKGLRYRQA
jgi:REP element-mobilizing transposase RayT